ncbi:MAG: ribonuclease III [Clostridia bacterium]|nr:ribonuclease III [Clostridia bacterium]
MGDAVIELLARRHIIGDGDRKISELNVEAKKYVTAISQSAAVERVLPHLTEKELQMFKYGRNAKGVHTPKSASAVDYRRATGLECLFGYLYLLGDTERAQCLFDIAYKAEE